MEQPSTVLQPPGTDPIARAEALLALTDLLDRTTDDLPVHQLEIDRSFVTGLADRTVVRTITTLGHDLGLEVVAEGVETPAVRDLLVELGVDLQQGWLHGRPAADDGEPP